MDEGVRCYLIRRMIDPSRFAEDMSTNPNFSFSERFFPKSVDEKTDGAAIGNWENEGGAFV